MKQAGISLALVVMLLLGAAAPVQAQAEETGLAAEAESFYRSVLAAKDRETVVVKHFCNTLFENSPGISSFKWCFPIIVGMRTDMIVPYVHISV